MNHPFNLRATAIAVALLSAQLGARAADPAPAAGAAPQSQLEIAQAAAKQAVDALGLQLWGYMRAGAYYAKDGLNKGHYGLGELGYNRLGNEGDQYFEFGIGKKWDISGAKVGTYWMPYAYRNSSHQDWENEGTKQIYADISGLSFAPELSFWGGQRYHRIQDVHIIDDWLMEDGDNFGAGVDGIKLGALGGTFNIAVYTEGNTDNSKSTSNGKRLNVQFRDIPITAGGTLNLTAGVVRGSFNDKKTSGALGLLYNQKLGVLTNSLFVQGSNGHADLRGKFYALNGTTTTTTTTGSPFICTTTPNPDGSCPTANLAPNPNQTTTTSTVFNPGAKQFRIVDAINWQSGPFGGQAMIGYQTKKADADPNTEKNFAIGGRLSYGIAKNIKLYGDMNYATLKPANGSSTQRLDKETIAVAVAPNTDFWTRPEVRLYLTRVGGNDAFKATGAFGTKSSAILAGVQVEAWWE
ncbi:MAG TPA: carbohydrate porin [Burkholderiaceae bacterium]